MWIYVWLVCLVLVNVTRAAKITELTFEIDEESDFCFYQHINDDTPVVFEYQVVHGGNQEINVKISLPMEEPSYSKERVVMDHYEFIADKAGIYSFCFINEFTYFSANHKIVYMSLVIGSEKPYMLNSLLMENGTLDQSVSHIFSRMRKIIDYQTYHRLRELHGRFYAEDLNSRVFFWATVQTVSILVISIGSVTILKAFFSLQPIKHIACV